MPVIRKVPRTLRIPRTDVYKRQVLSRMNRRYDTAEYEVGCALLRRYFEHPAITTDVIVGFPGETDEELSLIHI